ncbi:MAG TPA: zf-HC2 domain-containing protein [Kiritimatiellia bacterium]|nr:zf-HC2 domain-containing protein [Kiritimatiellia bacterium]HNR94614.1 zf-HC2 domain-containing protein [Kiritimatiellia bacterium]HNS81273.1 zf-HC2 domain-containing protein [Kiritimatiellia bacterium]HPA78855.1 zf-HC2 domain-containing protein [Kiritimatiellia bacterium]HQQ05259.1 zf-HC2 domain-containing protein [Kiritimatiellia bacterium]
MKCDKAQNWILLDQTGELNGRQVKQLRDHLSGCAACRQFQGEAAELLGIKARVNPTPDHILHAIRLAGAREHVREKDSDGMLVFWRPLAAAAAALLLVVLSWSMITGRDAPPVQLAKEWDNGIDEKLESLETMISSASYEIEYEYEWYEEDADELAALLLYMEEST